ncbi:heavy metal translocating P-type ATPase [bacterium]|nr:heavy metal translocating P-type ATPase [bacterium]
MVSGESVPIEKGAGSKVIGGTVNKNGFLKVSVSAVGKDTVLSKIIELVENAVATKAPIAKLADKIAGVFVPAVLLIAAISFVVWMIIGNNFEFSFNIAVSVLVISCPCALGLATPVAIMVGTGKGAENGILIKSSEALELSHLINTVAMDKTGTITYGKMKVASVANFGTNEQELISIAAGLEKQSEHPLGEAIIEYALSKGINIGKVSNFNSVTGKGISGEVENKRYYIGKLSYIEEVIKFSDNMAKGILVTIGESGQTPVIVANEEKILGIIAVADTVKENSHAAVKLLQSMGLKVIMLTGDNEITARVIANKVGINHYIANVLPENKEAEITEIRKRDNKVAFVGDGINDAPALASADVGVAIGAGTDIAIQSADVVLMKNDLMDVVTLIKLSRATIRNVKENLFWAFFYNSIGIPLAAGVFYSFNGLKLNPMIGAFAMSLSSICVVLNALRLRYVKITKGDKNMNELIIKIEGMSCSHCSKRVEEALNAIEGISAAVDLKKKKATIVSEKPIDTKQILLAVEKAGYSAKLWK